MFNFQNLYLFFIASILLNITPGNDMLYVASRSISQGVKAGMVSAMGIFVGGFVHITAAVLGLSIIISKSAYLFQLIKFAGAGYLIHLGIKALITKRTSRAVGDKKQAKIGYLRLGNTMIVPSVAYSTEEIEDLTAKLQILQVNSAVLCELLRSNNLFGIGPKNTLQIFLQGIGAAINNTYYHRFAFQPVDELIGLFKTDAKITISFLIECIPILWGIGLGWRQCLRRTNKTRK